MTKIATIKPKQAKVEQLTIDIVVKASSGLHRICKMRYAKDELYLIPTTHDSGKSGIDFHTSYHSSGEKHSKMTKGKLKRATLKFEYGKIKLLKIETLGEATPMIKNSEILLWKEQGAPLNLVEGALKLNATQHGIQSRSNIGVAATNYPIIQDSNADYVFEIDAESTPWIDMDYFLVKPGNVIALEENIKKIIDSWNDSESKLTWRPHEFKSLEKTVVFTNLSPWLAIVLFKFTEKSESSESS
jgi:hypothetical protein